jgi:hypothetical protein
MSDPNENQLSTGGRFYKHEKQHIRKIFPADATITPLFSSYN